MARRFSAQKLHILRNNIDIAVLMKNVLKMHFIPGNGSRRFSCPICFGFNTGINPESNLARCFTCQKNFNTIEIVMDHTKKNFVDAVKVLENYHNRSRTKININVAAEDKPQRDMENGLESLADVLTKILPGKRPNKKSPSIDAPFNLPKRIAKLEQKVDDLSSSLELVKKLISSKILPESSTD